MGLCWSSQESTSSREDRIQRARSLNQLTRPVVINNTTVEISNNHYRRNNVSAKACYGEFNCQNCGRFWRSTLSWYHTYQICKNCRRSVYPKNQREVRESDLKRNQDIARDHSKDLCQKCISLGYSCGNYNKLLKTSGNRNRRGRSQSLDIKRVCVYKTTC